MPTYRFKDINTNCTFEKRMGISERELYLKENPHIVQVPVACELSFDEMRGKKPDQGFTDLLKNMKQKAIGGHYMNGRYF
jgi:hypothetical protein